ncbi:MAG: DNA adenine methylase [Candidatus Lokiarchaeota archaeon]|nr:DNA adenine methylase [Candidatus Lokiarchaeota archaeon]
MTKHTQTHPFLKWAGGKRQLIPQMDKFFPKKYNKYIEPFIGGGAVFFYLLPENSIISDNNPDLINCYKVVKEDVEGLIESLKKHRYEKDYYYEIRSLDRDQNQYAELSDVEKASRSIYLNKSGYNGLYRVNSKGLFNVPFGRHKNPKICDEENLRKVSIVLKNVKIVLGSFEICLDFAEKDDFVYLDPPYYPLSDTALFTSYTKNSFDKSSQIKLHEVFKELDNRGCKIVLSNSYSEFILDLYKDFKIVTLKAKRNINSNSQKRGLINEVLILN